jgi:predicted HicB family RNase H-like nuclease
MRKLIDIEGELDKEGSLVNKLNVMAAKKGKYLKNYIEDVLKDHVDKSK